MEQAGSAEVVEILDDDVNLSDDGIEVIHPEFSSQQQQQPNNQNDQISNYYFKTTNNDMRHMPTNMPLCNAPILPVSSGPMASLMSSHLNGPQTMIQQQRQQHQPSPADLISNLNALRNNYSNIVNSHNSYYDNWDLSNVTVPSYIEYRHYNHTPRWDNILPQNLHRMFYLHLTSMSHFQITEELPNFNPMARTSLAGLRKMIKLLSKGHGTPVYDASFIGMEGDSRAAWLDRPCRWRVPLGCYHQLHTWLVATGAHVKGIPLEKLNSASVSKARAEQKAPPIEELVKLGVPFQLAEALAPYQRSGVKFISDKGGRALLADEMGLGKTVQSIAASAIYVKDWPVFVVCPAGAKFHWESEFLYWLGAKSQLYKSNNKNEDDDNKNEDNTIVFPQETNFKRIRKDNKPLLVQKDIKVFSSCTDLFDITKYKVVIASYSIATRLIEDGKIKPNMFQIILADESHNMKNYNTKRTKMLLPILRITKRCILISGTPSLAKPKELLPQLEMLRPSFKEKFKERYCNKSNNFELHLFLTAECMIRRLKNDILKDLPPKQRELVNIKIKDKDFQDNWTKLYEKYKELKIQNRGGKQQNAFMFKLYQITGLAKVKIIVKELKKFLDDPTSGKICIFAHHVAVLDAISISINNDSSLIRIDGRVNPQARTERIMAFQNDPTTRVALLGICAASVCVSLTASSTVWFAELFWTPSIMLQAEDRCHRIGQRATVKCKYFWARDTMDDTIWQMIKRKYENLGEYVDGITTTFAIQEGGEATNISDEKNDNDNNVKKEECAMDNTKIKKEFLSEAKEFQAEEIAELKFEEESTDESEECNSKPSAIKEENKENYDEEEETETKCKAEDKSCHSGISSSAAICLSDEEDVSDDDDDASINSIEEYPDMKVFKMAFPGATYGLVLVPHRGRVVVHQRTSKRIEDLGRNIKPLVGDILVSIDNFPIHTSTPFVNVLNLMKKKLMKPPVELFFAEDKGFAEYYKKEIRFKFANHQRACEDDRLPRNPNNEEEKKESGGNSIVPTVINLADEE